MNLLNPRVARYLYRKHGSHIAWSATPYWTFGVAATGKVS